MSVFTVNYSKTSPACSTLFPVFVWLKRIKMLTWNWFTGFSQHLDRTKTHERDVVRKRIRYTRAEIGADLCGVADILQGRVTGHHGTQVRQSAHAIQPASRVVLLRALKKMNYYMHKTESMQKLLAIQILNTCSNIYVCHNNMSPFNTTTHDLHSCNHSICLTHRVWRKQHWWCTGWRLVWWRNETSPSSPLDCSLLVCWMKQKTEALHCGIEGKSCVEQGDLIITGGKK